MTTDSILANQSLQVFQAVTLNLPMLLFAVTLTWVKQSDFKFERSSNSDLLILLCATGKSSEHVAPCDAFLGKQADSQATWKDLRALPTFRRWREDRGQEDVPRDGHGFAWQESWGPFPGVQTQVWPQNMPTHCNLDGKSRQFKSANTFKWSLFGA